MRFNLVSLFPEPLESTLSFGVVGQARKKNIFEVQTFNPRDFTSDVHKTVDDKPFGGGAGMLMMAEPLSQCMESIREKNPHSHRVYLSPKGRTWSDSICHDWVKKYGSLTLVCGRYEGVDQRWIEEHVDEEISIGDYVLSGGELGALVIVDSLVRLLPGALGNQTSFQTESFSRSLLEAPQFTRPALWNEFIVPGVLMSGHHKKIEEWNLHLSIVVTHLRRPELLQGEHFKMLPRSLEFTLKMSDEELKSCGLSRNVLIELLSEVC